MKRVLLKLSGEALAGSNGEIYDSAFVDKVALALKECLDKGHEIAVVVGAGNIWRGRAGGEMDRVDADRMGMLATVINAICLKDAISRAGAEAVVMTSVPMYPFAEIYSSDKAKAVLSEGKIVVFGAGLGIPFLSTDTTGAVRAAEIEADAILMAKNVDYIYTDDPRKNPDAKPLKNIKASEILAQNLKAMDATATAFCITASVSGGITGGSVGISASDCTAQPHSKKTINRNKVNRFIPSPLQKHLALLSIYDIIIPSTHFEVRYGAYLCSNAGFFYPLFRRKSDLRRSKPFQKGLGTTGLSDLPQGHHRLSEEAH